MDSVKINTLELENVKRVRAVALEPSASGLTVIGGNNNQGKTSILDAITWALGGDRYKPGNPARDGSAVPPHIKVTLSNGLIVERSGKNSTLKVTDPAGMKGGQRLLDSFIEELALNLPKFMDLSNQDKAKTLLRIIGVGDKLRELEQAETDAYNRRRAVGQEADRKENYAQGLPFYPDAPTEPVSASELLRKQRTILTTNAENQRKRQELTQMEGELARLQSGIDAKKAESERILSELSGMRERFTQLVQTVTVSRASVAALRDESTDQIDRELQNVDSVNAMVRANAARKTAEQDAENYRKQYAELSAALERTRQAKMELLSGAALPLEGLSVDNGELTYMGKKWDCMSGSDQLKVATAVVRALNPRCGFVLLDKLEQMDMPTLKEFGAWLESQNLQAIATRVSTGDECTIIIEDGQVSNQSV